MDGRHDYANKADLAPFATNAIQDALELRRVREINARDRRPIEVLAAEAGIAAAVSRLL